MFTKPKISVCIPVYKTESVLEFCVESVVAQNFKGLEIIIVNDGSSPKEGELSVSTIVKKLKKISKNPIKLIEHSENQGLLEARRTAVYEAKGEYIFILDSDDSLPSGALNHLYEIAEKTNADIIQGKANVTGSDNKEILLKRENSINNICIDSITSTAGSNQIVEEYLVNKKIPGFLWGKLIRREVYLEALNRIPPITCTFAEDFIQSLWIYNFSKSYIGTEARVYNYSIQSGVSSKMQITDLGRWEKVCSTAGVFTAIITEIEENGNPFTESQMDSIKIYCQKYVANNLTQLRTVVAPEIQEAAYEMLCEYWGKDLVKGIEELEQRVGRASVEKFKNILSKVSGVEPADFDK